MLVRYFDERVVRRQVCRTAIVEVRFSPDNASLALASHDGFITVLDRLKWRRRFRLRGHSAHVAHLDWSLDSAVLQSNCVGGEIIYWNVSRHGGSGGSVADSVACPGESQPGTAIRSTTDTVEADTKWATWTCTLGFPVMGIWADGASLTDVNAVDLSPDRRYVVTADDRGTSTGSGAVKLFNAPCVVEDVGLSCACFASSSSSFLHTSPFSYAPLLTTLPSSLSPTLASGRCRRRTSRSRDTVRMLPTFGSWARTVSCLRAVPTVPYCSGAWSSAAARRRHRRRTRLESK